MVRHLDEHRQNSPPAATNRCSVISAVVKGLREERHVRILVAAINLQSLSAIPNGGEAETRTA